jgi:hypothetical protein
MLSEQHSNQWNLDNFPEDIFLRISSYLDAVTIICSLRRVCGWVRVILCVVSANRRLTIHASLTSQVRLVDAERLRKCFEK